MGLSIPNDFTDTLVQDPPALIDELKREGIGVAGFTIDKDDYAEYVRRADYDRFAQYKAEFGDGLTEKMLEHYMFP